ncbi:MAG: excinuclease ABC subunit C, partial [Clostridiales bacterium]|nr:excinuclease ABC subunit C [Clostridiales bacterium]
MFDIRENLKTLPDAPGVYLHKDKNGEVIYVGKALSLKNRVRQYFQSPARQDPKVRAMVSHIAEFEILRTDSEMEALILECSLIKKYMPKYNVLLRDDKTYPYIKVTLNEEWPRVVKTRRVLKDGGLYFGPYTDAAAVNQAVDLLSAIYSLKRCKTLAFPENFRPCLHYHIGRCPGPCVGKVTSEEYRKAVDKAIAFLKGNSREVIADLEERMYRESEALRYEKAAEYRDYITVVKTLAEMIAFHNDMSKRDRKRKKEAMEERPTARSLSRTESFVSTFVPLVGKAPAEGRPLRVEAYDISHIAGTDSVGAMVVFTDGKAEKKAYRRFRIHTVEGADDTASLQEMLYRRLRRGLAEDPGFVPLPDLILMDGGKNQVNAAEKVVAAMKLNIPVAGMAKDDHHRSRALIFRDQEHALNVVPGLRRWIPEIQEEGQR